ncbi:uncharacterized protein DSM5745_04390 [Aspergillus mulundensis]|uniref:Uncharacterized protein n=1 Tax=Aspergillus mulundensis TaxID=1810919 RepID=A0A3D8SDA0_9EURO|nr:Uncharacterized protein DSM5745_04390 [Aspergillus mulundensis]RDW84064.1 Uncharacterized protein DSM5745_04390 [Aspergillus mulundensis]
MPVSKSYHIRPLEWENDPEVERYRISTLDYLSVSSYNNYALFFRLVDSEKPNAVNILKAGLERTLAQARHLCGAIEKDPSGGHAFTKRKDSTVQFVVQWLDLEEDAETYPSIDDIEEANFAAVKLGDLNLWSVPPMTYGEKPEAHIDARPVVAAYKANFVRGGLVFVMHHHHYANDVMGWAGLTHQLAENCYAIQNKTPFPHWDTANLDLTRLTKPDPPEEEQIDGPPQPQRHPAQLDGISLLFHLRQSKAAELKRLATPKDGSWISTYDAFSAFIWRTLTRLRAPVFNPDPEKPGALLWGEAVDMRRRMRDPPVPPRMQGNVVSAALSRSAPDGTTHPTVSDIIRDWPLSRLASYIRALTNSVTQEGVDSALTLVSRVRDKTALNTRIDSFPPMSILMTDHRDARVAGRDFGFGRPVAYRHLVDCVTNGVVVVYPPRARARPRLESAGGNGAVGEREGEGAREDEGCEFSIFYERDLAAALVGDAEWRAFFEYRGVDGVDVATTKEVPVYT